MREPVTCPRCSTSFEPPAQFTGGLMNCPKCGRAVDVPGLRDPLWLLLRLGALVAIGLVVWQFGRHGDPWLGAAVGSGLLFVLWLLSRCL